MALETHRTSTWSLLGAVFFLLVAYFCAYLPGFALLGEARYLAIAPTSVYFGNVRPGMTLTRAITIKNISDHAIDLLAVRSSCDCASTDFVPQNLISSKSMEFQVTWKIGLGDGPTRREMRIVYATKGIHRSEMIVTTATVIPDYRVIPTSLSVDRTSGGETHWRILVRPVGDSDMLLLNAIATDPSLKVGRPSKKNGDWRIDVSYSPNPVRELNMIPEMDPSIPSVLISTNCTNAPTFRVPLELAP